MCAMMGVAMLAAYSGGGGGGGGVSGVLFSFEERNSICLQDNYWLVRGRS